MTDRQDWEQQPQYPPQGYGQQYPQDQPWQPQQYDPGTHQQRIGSAPQDYSPGYRPPQDYPQQPYPGQQYPSQPYPGQPYPPGPPQQPYGYPPQQPAPRRRKRHFVRNVLAGLGALIVVIIGISVAASGGHSVQTTGSTGNSGAGNAGAAKETASIGSAITLTGNSSGEQVAVTVTKVISSASPGDELTSAPAGDRLYAVQFRLHDTGPAAYSDAPSNGAAVVDSAGQSYQAGLADTASGCASFASPENIAPGATGLGCIVFEVPKAAKITAVQFTLDSGMGPQTGQWGVR